DPLTVPPSPAYHVTPGDRIVSIAWDNAPELIPVRGSISALQGYSSSGYRVYRLSDWRGREAILPKPEQWALLAAFSDDSLDGAYPLTGVRDTTLAPAGLLFGHPRYPI